MGLQRHAALPWSPKECQAQINEVDIMLQLGAALHAI